jgi:hypothetical protein
VLLRSIETGLFYEEASKWTPDQTAAFDFETNARAIELVFAAHLDNVEMLLISDNPQFDMILPIEKKGSLTPSSPASGSIHEKSRGTPGQGIQQKSSPRS